MKLPTVVPKKTKEALDVRTSRDRRFFQQGKRDALMQLPRDNSVQSRDKDCYNMGYNLGELG